MQNVKQKKDWNLTSPAFQRLLSWLDEGVDSNGQSYLDLRLRLVAYFDRKNCLTPDELADETLNRVARRLEEEGTIVSETAARYCYIVARFVFLEYLRERSDELPLDTITGHDPLNKLARLAKPGMSDSNDENARREQLLKCLDQCTERLDAAQRDLIIRYYHGEQRSKIQNRTAMAQELGMTPNALSIRACRIRDRLETCVRECAGQE